MSETRSRGRWAPLARVVVATVVTSATVVTILEYRSRTRGVDHEWGTLIATSIALALSLLYFWSVSDAFRRPSPEWGSVLLSKPAWILVLLFMPWVALIPYVLLVWLPLSGRAGAGPATDP